MPRISTYVIFDVETTGLPYQEMNRTKIIEICLLAVSRNHIETSDILHPLGKLSLLFNPKRDIHPEAQNLTGLTNAYLQTAPTFMENSNTIINFLNQFPKPLCLVAHNGYVFDFKILLAEFNDIDLRLPDDILCIDTLPGFRKHLNDYMKSTTAKEDPWPELDVSLEAWQEIDNLTASMNISGPNFKNGSIVKLDQKGNQIGKFSKEFIAKENLDVRMKRRFLIESAFDDTNSNAFKNKKFKGNSTINKLNVIKTTVKKGEFTLSGLYKKIFNNELPNAHRADGDCFALLESITALKDRFLPWMDDECRLLAEISPLYRY